MSTGYKQTAGPSDDTDAADTAVGPVYDFLFTRAASSELNYDSIAIIHSIV